METFELFNYISSVSDYIEYSFYKNSSEIMEGISKKGFDNVLEILSSEEVKKGVYNCKTTWELSNEVVYKKDVTIDISGEVIYITEVIGAVGSADKGSAAIDIEKEYGDVLKVLKKKRLSDTEKAILVKVVKAFFE